MKLHCRKKSGNQNLFSHHINKYSHKYCDYNHPLNTLEQSPQTRIWDVSKED